MCKAEGVLPATHIDVHHACVLAYGRFCKKCGVKRGCFHRTPPLGLWFRYKSWALDDTFGRQRGLAQGIETIPPGPGVRSL